MSTKDSALTATATRILSSDYFAGLVAAVAGTNARIRPIDVALTLFYVAATARVIGRKTAGAGAAEELTKADLYSLLGTDTDGTLAGNSDTALATQKAVKTYVDALATAAGLAYQPLDSDLTAIAALTTTAYGRAFLALANQAALLALIPDFVASGGSAAAGRVPTPGATAGTERVLHEDATWRTPATKKAIALTDASAVAIDASLGDYFTLLTTSGVGATRKLGNVTNPPAAGYVKYITVEITQDGSGSRLVTYDTAYKFSATNPSPTVSTAASAVDRLIFCVDHAGNAHLVGIDLGGS